MAVDPAGADDNMPPPAAVRRRPVPALPPHIVAAGLHPVLQRVLAARGVGPGELEPVLARLLPVGSLPGSDAAVARLGAARARGERVVIVGDFDADGATATALFVASLRDFGFPRVEFLVPDRFRLGYGLSPAVADLVAAGGPALIVTVDNGIASVAGVDRARALGLEVLVTDHHLPPPELPAAVAIVNPNLVDSRFGSPALCGVGVAFYVVAALGRALAAAGLVPVERVRRVAAAGLDLVALGTVADVVPLDFNNRILVAEGLRRIRAGRTRPGLQALFAVAGRDPALATAGDLGFAVAPRLNAAGRLADMAIGVQCLLAPDLATAAPLAERLQALNAERRALQARMEAEAHAQLDALPVVAEAAAAAVVLFDERWHLGVVGLVAGRVRERTGRPAVAFARDPATGLLRGSARSVPGVNIRDCIAVALAGVDLPEVRFGGHAMAAGLTLPDTLLAGFGAALAAAVAALAGAPEDAGLLWSDGGLAPADLSAELAVLLEAAGPWGAAFPEPRFDDVFEVLDERVVGGAHLRLTVRHADGGPAVGAIAFGRSDTGLAGGRARLVYRLEPDRYRDRRVPQLVVEAVLP
jgi:single-stranded-DNA-specific exonuclease